MPYYPRLKDLREDKDLTQTEVAKIIGTSQSYYASYERTIKEALDTKIEHKESPYRIGKGIFAIFVIIHDSYRA